MDRRAYMDTPVWGDLDLDKVSVPGEFVSGDPFGSFPHRGVPARRPNQSLRPQAAPLLAGQKDGFCESTRKVIRAARHQCLTDPQTLLWRDAARAAGWCASAAIPHHLAQQLFPRSALRHGVVNLRARNV